MKLFVGNILLALTWVAVNESFTAPDLAAGFVLGYVLLWFSQGIVGPSRYFLKVRQVAVFGIFFLWEFLLSGLRVAWNVIMPLRRLRPGIVAVPLDATTDLEITLLANLITLTPGSLSLDVTPDRRVLYVHAMFIGDPDAFKRAIKEGFERRLLEVLR